MSIESKRRLASAAFSTLLLLAVFWPSPVVSINRLWLHQPLAVDDLSFLGREAPSWDAVFWCLAGVVLLAIIQSADASASMLDVPAVARTFRPDRSLLRRVLLGLAAVAMVTTAAWLLLDVPVLAWAEAIQSEGIEDLIRLLNRLGGGMNPVMLVVFLLVGGIAYVERRWIAHAIAMAVAGLGAGILAQIVKHLVGRARPELWLGPSHYAPGSSTSFPSGHTVGAFALAGVLVFGSRSWTLRAVAFALAVGVGMSRILAFRHWPSDVIASASIGLLASWAAVRSTRMLAE
jgi:membrane-associated phospholipid phosphatase